MHHPRRGTLRVTVAGFAVGLTALTVVACSPPPATDQPTRPARVSTQELLPPGTSPPPPLCQTEDEGTIWVYEDGSVEIAESGCVYDPDTGQWRS
jgi:hypothetical protein